MPRDLEALLRASRPTPHPEWQQSLEARLLNAASQRHRRLRTAPRRRTLVAGAGLALAGCALLLVLALASIGPLAPRDDASRARTPCRIEHPAPSGLELVRGRDGVVRAQPARRSPRRPVCH
jgi:hypothetical protein